MRKIVFIFILGVLGACSNQPELLFEDNFDGTSLNENHWNYELGDGCPDLCGWGNNERQVYTKKNVQVANGNLIIRTAINDSIYTSGRITTKDKIEFTYGTIEIRAKLATGNGIWPAIWMLGANIEEVGWPKCGEIDIMEYVGKEPHVIHTSLHTAASFGNTTNTATTTIEDIENGFHIFKAHWTENNIQFYIDDDLVYTFQPKTKNDNTWPFHAPFFLLLNTAVGGNFGGPEVDDTIFPQEFIIDYVRVYKP
ncbi:MAG: glycoside hydrolase family 16 protein [Marinirhabdus sp.]|nr:glycoside hydrolase family 16 protein [Marinirhabdus sp.]